MSANIIEKLKETTMSAGKLYLSLGLDAREMMAHKLREKAGWSALDDLYADEGMKASSLELLAYLCWYLEGLGTISADQLDEMAEYCQKQVQARA